MRVRISSRYWGQAGAIAAAGLLSAAPALATDGYFLNGVGAKAKGAGGVGIAYPQDALSIAANPASATELGDRLDIGGDLFVPDRSSRISGNGAGANGSYSGNGTNPFVLPEAGYIRQVSPRVALGIALYGNGGMNTDYKNNPFAAFGGVGRAGVNLEQIFVTPTLAVRVASGQSLGLSVIGAAQGFSAHGLQPFAAFSADPKNFTDRGMSWAFGVGVRAGYLGKLTDRLSVGAFYQSKIWNGRFKRYAGLFAGQGGFDVPESWGGGVAYRLTDRLDVSADVKRINYAGVAAIGNTLAPLFAGVPFGAAGGAGFGWRNITDLKAGAIYRLDRSWTLRTGYDRSGQPVQRSQTLLNILAPGVVHDHISAGATWTTPSGTEITGHVTQALGHTVYGQNSIPASFGSGEADVRLAETIAGIDFGFKF